LTRPLAIGDPFPDVALLTPAGESVGLASVVGGRPAVLIVMRHLGCLPCREHLLEVSRRRAEFGDVRLLCVTFVEPTVLAAYERELALDAISYFGDPARAVYAALGFERASFARVWLHPAVWRRYAALIARGRRPHPPGQDVYQLGRRRGARRRWAAALGVRVGGTGGSAGGRRPAGGAGVARRGSECSSKVGGVSRTCSKRTHSRHGAQTARSAGILTNGQRPVTYILGHKTPQYTQETNAEGL